MTNRGRVRVYIACSLDGFIAGAQDDLSWLTGPPSDEPPSGPSDPSPSEKVAGAVGYAEFIRDIGAMLMGRRTYDVVAGFGGEWHYGALPILVATRRALDPVAPTVHPITGDISDMVRAALDLAGGKDVYIDGGDLIRQALDADLIDDMIVTIAPMLLGQGIPLFAGVQRRHQLEFLGCAPFGGKMMQLHMRPKGVPK
jgi:dihydrofolate reductase